jgi:hypothetical protein
MPWRCLGCKAAVEKGELILSRAVTGVAWLEPGGAMVCGQSIGEKQNRFVVCFFVIGLAGHFCIFFAFKNTTSYYLSTSFFEYTKQA